MHLNLLLNDRRHKELMKQNREIKKRREQTISQAAQLKEQNQVSSLIAIRERNQSAYRRFLRQDRSERSELRSRTATASAKSGPELRTLVPLPKLGDGLGDQMDLSGTFGRLEKQLQENILSRLLR